MFRRQPLIAFLHAFYVLTACLAMMRVPTISIIVSHQSFKRFRPERSAACLECRHSSLRCRKLCSSHAAEDSHALLSISGPLFRKSPTIELQQSVRIESESKGQNIDRRRRFRVAIQPPFPAALCQDDRLARVESS